jgi:hypothetical protein
MSPPGGPLKPNYPSYHLNSSLAVFYAKFDVPSTIKSRNLSNPAYPFPFFFRRASVLSPDFLLDFLAELRAAAIAIFLFFFRGFPAANVELSNVS